MHADIKVSRTTWAHYYADLFIFSQDRQRNAKTWVVACWGIAIFLRQKQVKIIEFLLKEIEI
jgi:hypothetical protein